MGCTWQYMSHSDPSRIKLQASSFFLVHHDFFFFFGISLFFQSRNHCADEKNIIWSIMALIKTFRKIWVIAYLRGKIVYLQTKTCSLKRSSVKYEIFQNCFRTVEILTLKINERIYCKAAVSPFQKCFCFESML